MTGPGRKFDYNSVNEAGSIPSAPISINAYQNNLINGLSGRSEGIMVILIFQQS